MADTRNMYHSRTIDRSDVELTFLTTTRKGVRLPYRHYTRDYLSLDFPASCRDVHGISGEVFLSREEISDKENFRIYS